MVPTSRSWLRPRHHLALRSTHKSVTCRAHNARSGAPAQGLSRAQNDERGSTDLPYRWNVNSAVPSFVELEKVPVHSAPLPRAPRSAQDSSTDP